jgi:hypothetical protein
MRFLSNWSAYGIITRQDGPGGAFPDEVWVETGFGAPEGDGIPEVNSPLRFAPRTNESSR